METKENYELIQALQKKLDTVDYKYQLKFKLYYDGMYFFRLTGYATVECADKRDGSLIEIKQEQEYSIDRIGRWIEDFDHHIRIFISQIEKHELEEWLLINKVRVFDPH